MAVGRQTVEKMLRIIAPLGWNKFSDIFHETFDDDDGKKDVNCKRFTCNQCLSL